MDTCGIGSKISLNLLFNCSSYLFSLSFEASISIVCFIAAIALMSLEIADMFAFVSFDRRSEHFILSSAIIALQSSRKSLHLILGRIIFLIESLGIMFELSSRLNPESLAIAEHCSWSITILLCVRNGRPSKIFSHRFGTMRAHTGLDDHSLLSDESCRET